jgi:hypothetical protein
MMSDLALLAITLSFHGVSSFIVPGNVQKNRQINAAIPPTAGTTENINSRLTMALQTSTGGRQQHMHTTWSPQDLTKDSPGYLPIPDQDYVKKYQANPELWPVEFFVVAHRRLHNNNKSETQILVRRSANGTSKWGLGTGVPATRWMLSSSQPPPGYQWATPRISIEASNFPEFPEHEPQSASWTYRKIDICEDAFNGPDATEFHLNDPELEEYATKIRNELRYELRYELELLQKQKNDGENDDLQAWESARIAVVKNVLDNANSVAAIQGALRMSGLFASLDNNAPDPTEIVQCTQIFTMWPQMPEPMPLPSTPPEELQKEIATRELRMAETGRDPHKDKYGRKFTHKSTSNVSNTIHGVYFVLDLTDLPGLDEVPAFDLFGTKEIKREWKSLEDLKVLDTDGKSISTKDTKPTFISGFIVRQLVKDGVIDIHK